jgi:hypothetical protein
MFENKAWLKSGLAGAGVAIVLQILGIIPCVKCLILPITCVAWFIIPLVSGYLAATWAKVARDEFQKGAKEGALAGLVLGGVSGLVSIPIQMFSALINQGQNAALSALNDQEVDYTDYVDIPSGIVGAMICGSIGCAIGLVIDVLLSALGGIIKVAMSKK